MSALQCCLTDHSYPAVQQPSAGGICEGAGGALADAVSALQAWEAKHQGGWLADELRPRMDGNGADAFDGYDSLDFSVVECPAAAAAAEVPLKRVAAAIVVQLYGEPVLVVENRPECLALPRA